MLGFLMGLEQDSLRTIVYLVIAICVVSIIISIVMKAIKTAILLLVIVFICQYGYGYISKIGDKYNVNVSNGVFSLDVDDEHYDIDLNKIKSVIIKDSKTIDNNKTIEIELTDSKKMEFDSSKILVNLLEKEFNKYEIKVVKE